MPVMVLLYFYFFTQTRLDVPIGNFRSGVASKPASPLSQPSCMLALPPHRQQTDVPLTNAPLLAWRLCHRGYKHPLRKDRESYQMLKDSFTRHSDNTECLGRVVIAAASYSARPIFKPRPGDHQTDDGKLKRVHKGNFFNVSHPNVFNTYKV